MNYRQHKAKLMLDPEFKAGYEALKAEDEEDLKDAGEALKDYRAGEGIQFVGEKLPAR